MFSGVKKPERGSVNRLLNIPVILGCSVPTAHHQQTERQQHKDKRR